MNHPLPDELKQGEAARLFPVLSTTSKEGRTTSIVLACLTQIAELAAELLGSVGQSVGKRASISAFTEVVFKNQPAKVTDRPDGFIILKVGSRRWRALVEAKVGNNSLDADQIERYRTLAKENGVDCVITISNQFATTPDAHPLPDVRKSRSRVPVYHWSWMHILTTADLLLSGDEVSDNDQKLLLNELRRFLTHESAGVRGFERMPRAWADLNRLVSSGGTIPARSDLATEVLGAWHQETRDLSMILSRMTGMIVREKLPRKHAGDPGIRLKDEMARLRDSNCLYCALEVPDAAAPLEVTADLMRRSVDVGMTLKAPLDKKSTKARSNWLVRQLKPSPADTVFIRCLWPGASAPTQFQLNELRNTPDLAAHDKAHLAPHSFQVFISERLGAKFTQQGNFILELERIVPEFYGQVGGYLTAWRRRAPKIKPERATQAEVSPSGLAEDAEEFNG